MSGETLALDRLRAHIPDGGMVFKHATVPDTAHLHLPPQVLSFSDQELADELWTKIGEHFWFAKNEYAGKAPVQQWAIQLGNLALHMYNYTPLRKITTDEVEEISSGISMLQARFPVPKRYRPKAIAVTESLPRSPFKRPGRYDTHAMAHPHLRLIELATKNAAFRKSPYRNELRVSTLGAVGIHEYAHMYWDEILAPEWLAAGFTWHPVLTPVTRQPQIKFGEELFEADQPEACVTEYGKLSIYEDIPESMVAYLVAPELLVQEKRDILTRHDRNRTPAVPQVREVAPAVPKFPRTIRFALQSEA